MPHELIMRRQGRHLAPANPISDDDMALIPTDRDVLVTWKTPRNTKQHAFAWALATKVSEACDWLHDAEDAMDFLKIKCKHVKYLTDPRTGKVEIVPKSIAFASLPQAQFSRLLSRMVYVVCSSVIPGLKESDLRREIEAMVAGK